MRSRRMRAISAGVPSRNRMGTGSRASLARHPEGNRAGTPGGAAGVRRFIHPKAYRTFSFRYLELAHAGRRIAPDGARWRGFTLAAIRKARARDPLHPARFQV